MKKYRYKVTVGMPVYCVEAYIRKSMLSVLNQSFKEDMEIIAVDDLGSDKSIEIIKELQCSHPRGKCIKILSQPINMGCWAARNRILDEAKGEYIFLLDSDDYISENCIELLYKQAIIHKAEVVYGSVKAIDISGNTIDIGQHYLSQPNIVINESDGLAIFANKTISTTLRDFIWNILFSHDFISQHNIRFKKAQFNDDMIFSSDMVPLVSKAVLISNHTYYYLIRDNSLSNYQHRKEISLDEIKEFIRIYTYLKNKCKELREKPYFETKCTKGMILMFYMLYGVLKNKKRIYPNIENYILKNAIQHPFQLKDILQFKHHKFLNIIFYIIGKLPAPLSVYFIQLLGKLKRLI